MSVSISLLGPFKVLVDERRVPDEAWTRKDAATLVKLLALSPDGRQHREQVIDALWPDLAPTEAAPRLHKAAHFARKACDRADAVVLRGEMVQLFPGSPTAVDAVELESEAATALASGEPARAVAVLRKYPGQPLPADLYADWADDHRMRLDAVRQRLLRQGRCWREMTELDPVDEEASYELVRELASHGDRRAGLDEYERLDRALRRELGTHPGPRMQALRDQLVGEMHDRGTITPADLGRLEQEIRFCRTADNVTLAFACSGSGPPLVKAANWLTHVDHDWASPVWRHWLLELSRRHRLVRYDERGCGLSDWDTKPPVVDDWVEDLETVVDNAGLDRFPVLGISQGGAVAVRYAVRHPERVTRLVLYGTYAQGRLVRAASQDDVEVHHLQVELARLGWGRNDPALRQVFTAQFMPGAPRELWDAFNELQQKTTSAENAARVLALTGDLDVCDEAAQVRVPTLVLHARGDRRIPYEQGRLMASLIPRSRLCALESENHILLADEPAWPRFLAEVESFLAE